MHHLRGPKGWGVAAIGTTRGCIFILPPVWLLLLVMVTHFYAVSHAFLGIIPRIYFAVFHTFLFSVFHPFFGSFSQIFLAVSFFGSFQCQQSFALCSIGSDMEVSHCILIPWFQLAHIFIFQQIFTHFTAVSCVFFWNYSQNCLVWFLMPKMYFLCSYRFIYMKVSQMEVSHCVLSLWFLWLLCSLRWSQ